MKAGTSMMLNKRKKCKQKLGKAIIEFQNQAREEARQDLQMKTKTKKQPNRQSRKIMDSNN